jgi:hypothetical protein
MNMRPPQEGHGRGSMRGSAAGASGVSGCSERAGTASNSRALAMLAARLGGQALPIKRAKKSASQPVRPKLSGALAFHWCCPWLCQLDEREAPG